MNKDDKKGFPFLTILIAVLLLIGLSFVPWGKITGNNFKDFDLFSDLHPEADTTATANDIVDPALEAALREQEAFEQSNDTVVNLIPLKEPRINGVMVIEDYTPGQVGLKHFKEALAKRAQRPARIAFLGDSYIEGDIITSELRSLLQDKYGGNGVGYIAASSDVAGFRRSIGHSSKGWTIKSLTEACNSKYFTLQGTYTTAGTGASIYYRGVDQPHRQKWTSSKMMFIAPSSAGSITLTADSVSKSFAITPSPDPQLITLDAPASTLTAACNVPGLIVLGVWLEDNKGVSLDNMSVRGDAGISRRYLNAELAHKMSQHIDYDLVVLEYGINALTANKKEYSGYGKVMGEVIKKVRECYPNADILLLGIGDRGQKLHGEFHSMTTAPAMVEAQRATAQKYGVLFWDIREAMGGEDAIVKWRERKLVNADYIHLNFDGGREIGTLLSQSIINLLNGK